VNRRAFTLLGAAAMAWPMPARAQQATIPVIGFLSGQSPETSSHLVAAFRQGLQDTGYAEGRNVAIEFRWALGQSDRLPALAADLVGRRVTVIAATAGGGTAASLAAKAATTTIPIVFTSGTDPVRIGLVHSLNRPGGNVTGVIFFSAALGPKRLGILRDLVRNPDLIAVLVNPTFPDAAREQREVDEAARTIGQRVTILQARDASEIDTVFEALVGMRAGGLLVCADPFFIARREQFAALAARHAIPAIFEDRDFAVAGGLMSYGASFPDAVRQVGTYTGRILRGEKPADLPVLQPTKFELVINLRTARILGLSVPGSLLALADEVIE
jgi:putative ABC transport system substrate-binding protein